MTRKLYPDDILITDDSGPISMAGTMGGLATEIDDNSTNIVIEGAHFSDTGTAKMSRRHRLHSEASYRFERGVDRELPPRATARAAALLATLGGASVVPGLTDVNEPVTPVTIEMAADYPDRVAGMVYGLDAVVARLQEVGCDVRSTPASHEPTIAPWRAQPPDGADHHAKHDRQHTVLIVTPPSWRPDLTDPADLAEEVIRLEGYSNVPVSQPRATAGRGLTARQKTLRAVARTLSEAGFVEVHSDPFGPADEADSLMLPPEDPRRPTVRSRTRSARTSRSLRTTLLPGLFRTLARNIGRGFGDMALFETGLVFRPRPGAPATAPILATDRGPTEAELATSRRRCRTSRCWSRASSRATASCPAGGVLAAPRPGRTRSRRPALAAGEPPGAGRAGGGGGPVAPRPLRRAVRARHGRAQHARPRTAGEWLAGFAGELHPRVIAAYGLPPRSCAFELDFAVLAAAAEAPGPVRGPRCRPTRWPPRTSRSSSPTTCPPADVAAALAAARATCSRTSGCSTSTPAPARRRAASRWPTRCGSAPQTGRSRPRRPPPPATPPSPRPPAGPGRCCGPEPGSPTEDQNRRIERDRGSVPPVRLVPTKREGRERGAALAPHASRILGRSRATTSAEVSTLSAEPSTPSEASVTDDRKITSW